MSGEREKTTTTENKSDPKFQLLLVIIPAIVAITVAIIGCFSSILPPLFTLPIFQRIFEKTSTPIPTEIIQLTTPVSGEEQPLTPTPLNPPETVITDIPSNPGGAAGMQAILYANQTSGNAPLRVKLDARSSYFIDNAGTNYPCGPCNFTWQIRQGANAIYGPTLGGGTLDYRFGSKGTFVVTVYVCRNNSTQDCAGNGTMIEVR